MQNSFSHERYQRQLILKKFGIKAQQKLADASVLVVGAGGLGCPLLSYLAAAGLGRIGIIDDDIIAIHNLHRQPLYATVDIGNKKAIVAKEKLKALNPEIIIDGFDLRLDESNCLDLFRSYDYVADCTDNFATRYMINDACVILDKPLIYAAVSQFEGQISIFNFPDTKSGTKTNYRDLFPQPPNDGEILNCEEAGVLGVLPGIVGTMMASETIKLITGTGKTLASKLFTFNILNNQSLELQLTARPETRKLIPADETIFRNTSYEILCNRNGFDLASEEFAKLISGKNTTVIDVRELHELPILEDINHIRIPMSILSDHLGGLVSERIVFVCQSGIRSRKAAGLLSAIKNPDQQVYSLAGGVENWLIKKQILHHV